MSAHFEGCFLPRHTIRKRRTALQPDAHKHRRMNAQGLTKVAAALERLGCCGLVDSLFLKPSCCTCTISGERTAFLRAFQTLAASRKASEAM